MKAKLPFVIILGCLLSSFSLRAQTEPAQGRDTIPFPPDSTLAVSDSLLYKVTYSNDSLDAPVNTGARDSIIYDIKNKKIYLYGAAEVTYTTIKLNADYIIFDWESNIVSASGVPDSSGRMTGIPQFADGEQDFTADSMRYNFKSRKGIVYDVTTEESGVIIHGARSRFETTPATPGDTSSRAQNIIYNQSAIFTSCTDPEPHYGIRSRKQKIIPDKLAVVGPSNVEIMGVPTPLWLPFAFFPLSKGRKTGLIFPRDYEYSPAWGFGIRDIGWYFPLGDNFNLTLTADVYLKSRWGITARSDYKKRYKFSGQFDLSFQNLPTEQRDGSIRFDQPISFTWQHTQERTAHPSNTFGGNINIQTGNFRSRVFNDAGNVLQSQQLNSNFSFNKVWQDKPISFSAALSHSQNNRDSSITLSFPNLQFQTQTLYPFKRKEREGEERWYESVTLRYTAEARNTFQTKDSLFLTQEMFDNAEYGVQQSATSGTSFKLFKYFNLNPNVDYREVSYFSSIRREFVDSQLVRIDTIRNPDSTDFTLRRTTISNGRFEDFRQPGFRSWRAFSASVSLNTQIFGTLQFKRGFIRGLRHVAKVSTSLSYSPNYLNPRLRYFEFIQGNGRFANDSLRYSVFEQNIYGGPPQSAQQLALNYSINNIFEAKIFGKRDTTARKIKLFDNLYVNGSYNIAADTMKWSIVSVSGTARLFKDITTLSVLMQLDPYIMESNGQGSFSRVNKLAFREQGKLLRFDNANLSFNTGLTVGKLRELFTGEEPEVVEDLRDQPQGQQPQQRVNLEEDFLSLFENFGLNHNFVLGWNTDFRTNRDTFLVSVNSLNVQGTIQLSKNWRIGVGNFGYDFAQKDFSYPSISFTRDLHCWEMGMSWQPTRGTYSFYIQVKPGTFDFLRLPYQRNNADAVRAFQ